MRRSILLFAALALLWASPASAQVSMPRIPLGQPFGIGRPLADLNELSEAFNQGNWEGVQAAARALLKSAITSAKGPAASQIAGGLDVTKHYVIVTWLMADPFDKTILARVVVHEPSVEPFSLDLPGVGVEPGHPGVFEVFLSRGLQGKLVSVYASTPDKDPFAEQLPAFVQAIANPLFAVVGALRGGPPKVLVIGEPAPVIAASVARLEFPSKRATIRWKALAKEPVEARVFAGRVDTFAATLALEQPSRTRCAPIAIEALRDALKGAPAHDECSGKASTAATCRTLLDSIIREAVGKAAKSESCSANSASAVAEMEKVDAEFRAFAAANMSTSAEADLTFHNRPLTHWAFGAGTGVLTNASLTLPRVSVENGRLVADPLPRVVTMAFVNWSPGGYDPERDGIAGAERVRPFFGATLTPDFGLTAGINVLLVRGIGITAAGVVMFSKGADANQIGSPPANPEDPYRVLYARGWLLGISYNFK